MGERGDFRVPVTSSQDAPMMDIGDGGRPSGDPLDVVESWASKVSGSNAGGRLSPERVLDKEFVMARMRLEFPDGEDGEPVITIAQEVLDVMNGLWKQCIIVKVLGRHIALPALNKRLREMWNPKGGMHVLDLPRQFFMIRFDLEDEYLVALTGGPWRAFGSHLMVQAWSPDFDPLRNEIVTTPVWVRLSNIPLNLYHETILLGIVQGLGKPIKVDLTTLHHAKARFARVCVEVNLSKPLKGTITINGERYFVAYEGLSNICSGCGIYGHLVHNCPRRVVERTVAPVTVEVPVNVSGGTPQDDGFTVVRRTGRKGGAPENSGVATAGRLSTNLERNLRDISGRANMESIDTSNSFGNLEEVIEGSVREVAASVDANKENMMNGNYAKKGKSVAQGKAWAPVDLMNKIRAGKKDKTAGGKVGEANGPKPRNGNSNRPVRGLVFGPTRKEIELSGSGKRLRVDESSVYRQGGGGSPEKESRGVDGVSMSVAGEAVAKSSLVDLAEAPQNREVEMQNGLSAVVATSLAA